MSDQSDAESGQVEPRNGSVVRRRQLARRLRLLRERAGLKLEEAAPRLDWSASKLSRIENAQQAVDVHWVRSMLDLYQVGADDWAEIIDLCREARQKGWWRPYGLGDDSYVGLETEASTIFDFTLAYVPGLLQTAEYARAVMKTVEIRRSREQLSNFVAVRLIRQQRLSSTDHPLGLNTVIDEAALHRVVGNPRIHAAQLRHLLQAALLDTVDLQVLPATVGAHPAMVSPFTILRFDGPDQPDIAYVEHTLGALLLEKEADVLRARLLFDRLRSVALSPADSVDLIKRLAERT
jgi:transcriptional regulator with XRE-family HTH domain